jgi:hypothetical protein
MKKREGLIALILFVNALMPIVDRGYAQVVMKDERGMPISAIVIVDDADILEHPGKFSKTKRKARWLESFYVCDQIKSGSRHYLQLAKVDLDSHYDVTELVGWIEKAHCLDRHEAMKTEHAIFYKAIVINRWEDTESGATLKAAPSYAGPGVKYRQVAELGLFNFYYVYAEQKDPRGRRYVLLGSSSRIPSPLHSDQVLIGWVPKSRIAEWNTRQAAQYDKSNLDRRTEPVAIFETKEEAQFYAGGRKAHPATGSLLEPIALEDINITEWEYHWQRFPIFETFPMPINLMHVGYIGDQIELDSGGVVGTLNPRKSRLDSKLSRLEREVKNADILFVIDATGSMRDYFAPAASAVERIMSTLHSEYDSSDPFRPKLRFSVLFYRDYADGDSLYWRRGLSDDTNGLLRFIKGAESSGGGDEPEAVYFAILTAVEQAHFKDTSFKALVLMGDKGNHLDDPRGYTQNDITTRLKAKDITFLVYHVVAPELVIADKDVAAFRWQTDAIIKSLAEDGRYISSSMPDSISQCILQGMHSIKKMAEDGPQFVKEIRTGSSVIELETKYGTVLTRKLTRMMRERGIDPGQFVHQRVQLFETGWASEVEPMTGQRQLETMVLVTRTELQILMGVIAGFINHIPKPETIVQLWTNVLRNQLGEVIDPERPVSDYIQEHMGLPVRENLLRKSLSELSMISPNELQELFRRLKSSLDHLNDIQNEVERKFQEIRKTGDDVSVGEERTRSIIGKRKYWWSPGLTSEEFAWLRMEDMP